MRHILAISCLLLISGGAFAQSQHPALSVGETGNNSPQTKPNSTQDHAATTDQRGTEQSPPVVKILNPQNVNAQSTPDQNGRSGEEPNNFSLLNILLVIATFGLFGVGFWQGSISRMTAKRQLRAYITVKGTQMFATQNGIEVDPPRQIFAGCVPGCKTQFANSGQTPAYDVELSGAIGFVKWPVNPADLKAIPIPTRGSKSIIGPGGMTTKWDIQKEDLPALTRDDIEGLIKGTHAIVVFGEVRYKNVFKEKCFLRYRYFTGGPTGLRGVTLSAHDEGNEADYTE